jgi:hypothetical protein
LLRAGAVDIGYRDAELIPRSADLDGLRQRLAGAARRVLAACRTFPLPRGRQPGTMGP